MNKLKTIQTKIKNINITNLAYTITEKTQDSWHTSQMMGPALRNVILDAKTEEEINLIDHIITAITGCTIEELINHTENPDTNED